MPLELKESVSRLAEKDKLQLMEFVWETLTSRSRQTFSRAYISRPVRSSRVAMKKRKLGIADGEYRVPTAAEDAAMDSEIAAMFESAA